MNPSEMMAAKWACLVTANVYAAQGNVGAIAFVVLAVIAWVAQRRQEAA